MCLFQVRPFGRFGEEEHDRRSVWQTRPGCSAEGILQRGKGKGKETI